MFTLLSKKIGYVDLYYNDVFALDKSLEFCFSDSSNEYEVKKVKSLIFYFYKMKLNLYQGNYQ